MRGRTLRLLLPAVTLPALHAAPAAASWPSLRRVLLPRLAGEGSRGSVALTFDDGPDAASTPAFLDELDRIGARATFFVLGQMLHRNPDLGRRLADRGHEVGVHGWTHRNHLRLSPLQVDAELRRTVELVAATSGRPPAWFRPPYGVLTGGGLLAARRLGLRPVLWTAWGRDWEATAGPQSVLRELRRGGVRGGATLLLHDSDCTSAPGAWRSALGALPLLAADCAAANLPLVPLGEHVR